MYEKQPEIGGTLHGSDQYQKSALCANASSGADQAWTWCLVKQLVLDRNFLTPGWCMVAETESVAAWMLLAIRIQLVNSVSY